MKFRLDYSGDALNLLATVWLQAEDRDAVTAAQAAIDMSLQHDPYQGKEVHEGLYGLAVPPLKVLYEINNNLVYVTAVGLLP